MPVCRMGSGRGGVGNSMVGAVEENGSDQHAGSERHIQSERLKLAAALYKLGRYMDALTLLDDLAKERPDSRHVLYSQGMCLIAVGHLEAARGVCEQLETIKGHTAASLAFRLKVRIEEIESRTRRPRRRTAKVMAAGLLRMAVRPKGLLVCALFFTGAVFIVSALQGEPAAPVSKNYRPIVYAAQPATPKMVEGSYVDIPTFYLAGHEEPVRYAIVFCPYPERVSGLQRLDDAVGEEVAENWVELRGQVEEALKMAVQTAGTLEGMDASEVARVAVLPREGLALAGGLRGKVVERYKPGSSRTLRELASVAGAPDAMALWPEGTGLTGIEGDICWWGRLGVATNDIGVITHLVIVGEPVEAGVSEGAVSVQTEGSARTAGSARTEGSRSDIPLERENPEAASGS